MEDHTLFVEEMGSSNGSWINSQKMIVGKKIPYAAGDVIHLGKSSTGITITIENLSVQKAQVAVNSDNEKTLVYKLPAQLDKKVEATSTRLVANGAPVSTPSQMTRPSMKIVENITEHKHGLEDKVKNLINQEADKLREMARVDSNEILNAAHAKEKEIIHKAQIEAKAIIQEAKFEVASLKKETEDEIRSLQEKAQATKEETENLLKNYKTTAARIDSTINNLKNDESQVHQKIKFLEDNVSSIQDKIRNETSLLEDIKNQAVNLKKNADLKFEEIVMEERRARARIETEIIEAKTQTAKIFAEAEKVQSQKSMMEADISELRSHKGQIERDVNELQINYKRQEYDLEKLNREYNALLDEKFTAQTNYETLLAEGKGLADKFMERENSLIEQQKELQERVDELKLTADQIIDHAHNAAAEISHAAQEKATELAEESAAQFKILDQKKSDFYAEFEAEKKNKLQDLAREMDKQKSIYTAELKKIELKKDGLINEMKWLEESAHKKCEKIVSQGQVDAESLKVVLQKETERHKAALDLEFQTLKAQHQKENEVIKAKAQSEIQALKEEAHKEIFQLKKQSAADISAKQEEIQQHSHDMKMKADQFMSEEKMKWDAKHEELQSELQKEIKAAHDLAKNHEAALEKTEALKDQNFIDAQEEIKAMMAEAHAKVKEVENEASQLRSKEQSSLLELRKAEVERIEDLKAKFEQSKIDNRKEMAEAASLAVAEFLTNDMIKQRNLMLNESLIKKIAERARKLVIEANLGRIQASEKGSKPFPTRDYRKMFKWVVRLSGLAALVYLGFYVWETYPNEVQMIQAEIEKYFKDNNLSLNDLPTKDQIIEFLR